MWLWLVHNAVVHAAVAGAVAAAGVDIHAFLTWKKFHDGVVYDWATAAFRWFQGAVYGALVAGGLNVTGLS